MRRLIRATALVPTTSSASGVWYLGEAQKAHGAGIWPVTPPPAKTLTFVTHSSSASSTTHTLTGISIGTASSDRVVVVAGYGFNGGTSGVTLSGVTIDGNSMTVLAQAAGGGAGETYRPFIAAYALASGTTADVVVTFSANMTLGWSTFTLTGTGGAVTANATATDATIPLSTTLAIPASGCGLGVGGGFRSTIGTATWAGLTTEDVDTTLANANNAWTVAHLNNAGGATTPTCSITYSGGALTHGGMALVSW